MALELATANVLAYLMNFIKEPELYGDKKVPVGSFFLDEFQKCRTYCRPHSGKPAMQGPIVGKPVNMGGV